ncbi:hypothetical protein PWT90_07316 [Aphanocladium album]|nr:hypothetical protein PWT90_07316 [Aphanocladium album]
MWQRIIAIISPLAQTFSRSRVAVAVTRRRLASIWLVWLTLANTGPLCCRASQHTPAGRRPSNASLPDTTSTATTPCATSTTSEKLHGPVTSVPGLALPTPEFSAQQRPLFPLCGKVAPSGQHIAICQHLRSREYGRPWSAPTDTSGTSAHLAEPEQQQPPLSPPLVQLLRPSSLPALDGAGQPPPPSLLLINGHKAADVQAAAFAGFSLLALFRWRSPAHIQRHLRSQPARHTGHSKEPACPSTSVTRRENCRLARAQSCTSLFWHVVALPLRLVIFDVRNDSDALYKHFNIRLAGMQDLQLMEVATRSFGRKHVNGLAKCIERDASLSPAERQRWKDCKETGVRLFAPERGGSYKVFNHRPLSKEILQYCVQDVHFMPRLWAYYNGKMTPQWR